MDAVQVLMGGIQRFSIGDGSGIRTTVFFKGCPLACQWCHNPELIRKENQLMYTASRCIACGACIQACPQEAISWQKGVFHYDENKCKHCFSCVKQCSTGALRQAAALMTEEEIMDILTRDRGYYEKTGGGVTFSGGECTTHYEFLIHLMDLCRTEQLNLALDTSGYCPWDKLAILAGKADWILYDMKCMDDTRHRELTGVSNQRILSNLKKLAKEVETREKLIIRMPLVSGINDTPVWMEQAGNFFCQCGISKVHLLPYHRLGISKNQSLFQTYHTFEAPSQDYLEEIAAGFRRKGMEVTILGM